MVPIFTIGHKRLHRGKIRKKVGGIKITKKKHNYGAKSEITNDGKKILKRGKMGKKVGGIKITIHSHLLVYINIYIYICPIYLYYNQG